MKFLILILLIPTLSYCQFERGTKIIKIKGVSFREIVQHLIDVGYTIDKIDSNYNYVVTEYKDFDKWSFRIKYDIRVKDSIATLKGKTENMGLLADIEYYKHNPLLKTSFVIMNNFATSFNKPLEYFKSNP